MQGLRDTETGGLEEGDAGWRSVSVALAAGLQSSRDLTTFLYLSGRQPYSVRWDRLVGGDTIEALFRWYGLHEAHTESRMARAWSFVHRRDGGWLQWRCARSTHAAGKLRARWKLYLNLHVESIPKALPSCLDLLESAGADGFKVAGNLKELTRPDRFVAYFPSRESLQTCASSLYRGHECRAGSGRVPFSVAIPGVSVASWGLDPPFPGTSWRYWLCRTLARLAASTNASATPRERLAQLAAGLTAHGVDPETWAPSAALTARWCA